MRAVRRYHLSIFKSKEKLCSYLLAIEITLRANEASYMMIIIIIIIMMMISAYVGRLFSLLLLVLLIIASAYENDCDYWLYHRFARRPWRIACFVVEWNL